MPSDFGSQQEYDCLREMNNYHDDDEAMRYHALTTSGTSASAVIGLESAQDAADAALFAPSSVGGRAWRRNLKGADGEDLPV